MAYGVVQKGKNVTIHEGASIGDGVSVGEGTIIYPNVTIGPNTFIGPYCTLGEPSAAYYKNMDQHAFKRVFIGKNSLIRSHTIIYEDVAVGDHFQTGHRVTIREKTQIGNRCRVGTLCDFQGKLNIGDYVSIHSNVHLGQLSVIEDFVWIYPYVVLTNDPYPPMGKLKGVTVRKFAQIATSATILPGLEIGENALVGAGALVRENVPAERVVVGNPAKDICSVRQIKDENNNAVYPWKEHLKDNRGFPWQDE